MCAAQCHAQRPREEGMSTSSTSGAHEGFETSRPKSRVHAERHGARLRSPLKHPRGGASVRAVERSIIFWGMASRSNTHGTDNGALFSLALERLSPARSAARNRLHPSSRPEHVHGVGCRPHSHGVSPETGAVEDPAIRGDSTASGHALDPNRGLTVVEIMHAAGPSDVIKGCTSGENPRCRTLTCKPRARSLAHLEHLVVQTHLSHGDGMARRVVFAASAHDEKWATSPTQPAGAIAGRGLAAARHARLASHSGAGPASLDWNYTDVSGGHRDAQVYPSLKKSRGSGSYAKMQDLSLRCARQPGNESIFATRSHESAAPRSCRRPAAARRAAGRDLPMVLTTVRSWNMAHGSMTRRASNLDTSRRRRSPG